ncbi:MAG: hypothetical protein ACM3S1_09095 [Hyphomicrobiales bacterium]
MAAPAAGDALALAEAQLARLRAGDVDGYLTSEGACDLACRKAAEEPSAGPLLEQLIPVVTAIGREFDRLMAATSSRMAGLQRRRRLAGAYLPSGATDGLTMRDV